MPRTVEIHFPIVVPLTGMLYMLQDSSETSNRNDGTKAADASAKREGVQEGPEDSFFADSESSMGDSLDASSADFVMLECPGTDVNNGKDVEIGYIPPVEGDLSHLAEGMSLSHFECSVRWDSFSETKEILNAEKLHMTTNSEERKMPLDSPNHSDENVLVVESLLGKPSCSADENPALCHHSSEAKERALDQREVESQGGLRNPDLVMEENENDLPENITSFSIEDRVPTLKQVCFNLCENLINREARSDECVLKDGVENSRPETQQELSEEPEFRDLGNSWSVAMTQFSQKSDEAESPPYLSPELSSDDLLQGVEIIKTPLEKDFTYVELNEDNFSVKTKFDEAFKDGHSIQHHLIDEQISFKSAPSIVVQSSPMTKDQHITQNAAKIPESEDPGRKLSEQLRVNQNDDQDQRAIVNTNISNEDAHQYQCFQSRNTKTCQDEAKEDCLESEENLLHVDLTSHETDLEQKDDTSKEDQSLQKNSGTIEDPASAQKPSQKASGKSDEKESENQLNEDNFSVKKFDETFQGGHNIQHHLTDEQINLKSAPSFAVQLTPMTKEQYVPQNAAKIPESEDPGRKLSEQLRVNQNDDQDQSESVNTNISNEDAHHYSRSKDTKTSHDEAKEDCLESEGNLLHVDLTSHETDLEQKDVSDTSKEDQSLQENSGTTEDPTSAQKPSKEASEKSDAHQCFQSRNTKTCHDDAKEDCLESEGNLLHVDLTSHETDLEQKDVSDTSKEDQSLQEISGTTEDPTSAQKPSKKASGKPDEKESEKQSHECAKHQFPEEMITNQTPKEKEIPKPSASNEDHGFQKKNSSKDLSENAISRNAPTGQIPKTLPCDEPRIESAKSKCDLVESVADDSQASQDSTKKPFSGELTKEKSFVHKNLISHTNGGQPPRKISSGTSEDQAVAKDESLGQSPVKSTEKKTISVQLVQLESTQNEQDPEITDNTNSNGSTTDESLNFGNVENVEVSIKKTPSPAGTPSQLRNFRQEYKKWDSNTDMTLKSLKKLHDFITFYEQIINECKIKCIKHGVRNKLKKEHASWFDIVTGAMGSVFWNCGLSGVSLVHALIIVVARARLLHLMNINHGFKKRMYSSSPSPMAESNSVKDCIKDITRTTICGAVCNVIGKINITSKQNVKETTNKSSVTAINTFIHGLCDIIENLWSDETSSDIMKTLRDFLTDNQPIVEVYLAASKTLYGSCDLLKALIWNPLTRRGPDMQTKITDFVLVMQDYEHHYVLHEQVEGNKHQSSVVLQIERASAAIQAEASEIKAAVKETGIFKKLSQMFYRYS